MEPKTYDPSQGSLVVGGTLMSDKAWNSITIERVEDGWSFNTSTSGKSTRTKNLNKRTQLTIAVPQSSDVNDLMSAKYATDSLQSCTFIDRSGTTVATMPYGTIVRIPSAEFAKESGEREWMIEGDAIIFLGGN